MALRGFEQEVSESVADFCESFEVRVSDDGGRRLCVDDMGESESKTTIIMTVLEMFDEVPSFLFDRKRRKSSLKHESEIFERQTLTTKC